MRHHAPERSANPKEPEPWWRRIMWFALIWAMSVAALGVVGYGIKLMLR